MEKVLIMYDNGGNLFQRIGWLVNNENEEFITITHCLVDGSPTESIQINRKNIYSIEYLVILADGLSQEERVILSKIFSYSNMKDIKNLIGKLATSFQYEPPYQNFSRVLKLKLYTQMFAFADQMTPEKFKDVLTKSLKFIQETQL